MNIIGTFTLQDESYVGTVRTLTVEFKARFVPNAKSGEKAPDYRIQTENNHQVGAAWRKVGKTTERPYLSVVLDDPSFPATINARLVDGEDGNYDLVWTRSNKRS